MAKIEISANLGENDFDPKEFVDAAGYAEEAGFSTVWFGDHIFPWYHSGKRSSFVWSMMPAALEKTDRIKVGPWVTVPTGARYHPAIIAQAAATLDNMYPGRLLLGFGTGEALNERPFWNDRWPKWEERMDRMTEGIRLIRQMWESKEPFKFEGKLICSFETPEYLLKNAWRTLGIWRKDSWSTPNPIEVENEGRKVTLEQLQSNVHFCKSWKDVVKLIETYQEAGVNEVNISSGCTKKMIRAVAKNVDDVF